MMNKWRKYPNEKPRKNQKVIVCDDVYGEMRMGRYDGENFYCTEPGVLGEVLFVSPTHWMHQLSRPGIYQVDIIDRLEVGEIILMVDGEYGIPCLPYFKDIGYETIESIGANEDFHIHRMKRKEPK